MSSKSTPWSEKLSRLWQPKRGLFWLMLVFNAMSSVLAWVLHWMQPTGSILIVLTLLTLGNAGMGWWLLTVLWRDSAPLERGEKNHV
jgi:hypothetical protein